IALIYFEEGNSVFRNFSYGLLVVAATGCYAISINGIKRYLHDISAVKATLWAFCLSGPVALFYLFGFTDFISDLQNSPQALSSLGYVAILAICGTALSVILYNVLIKQAGVIFASLTTY